MNEDNSDPRQMDPLPGGFDFSEVEIAKLALKPGEVLAIRVYSSIVDDMDLAMLRRQLASVFPDNKILLFALPSGDKMDISVIAKEEAASCAAPTSYCNDCGCGKKERIEAAKKREE
jgi:hypothetical protein